MSDARIRFRITSASLGIAFCLFLLISLISFNVRDWPNPDVASGVRTIGNLCGPLGSFLAYYSLYYMGPAAFLLLIVGAVACVWGCRSKPIDQPILRAIGVLLLATVVSATAYMINPGDEHSLSVGNGGILGIAAGHFLIDQTARIGAILILIVTFFVGLMLAADNILTLMLRLSGMALGGLRVAVAGAVAGRHASGSTLASDMPTRSARGKATAVKPQEEDEYEEYEEYEYEEEDGDEDEQVEEPTLFDAPVEEGSDHSSGKPKPEASAVLKNSLDAVGSALARMRGVTPNKAQPYVNKSYDGYEYPPIDLLGKAQRGYASLQEKVVKEKSRVLARTLQEFNISANVVAAETGPVITMFELELAPGIKVAQISNLANDLARSLGSPSLRVVAPLPGRHTIGIEVPNSEKEKVRIRELMESGADRAAKMQIPLFLGKDASGDALISDLAAMPHVLIAGTTGSGKSVCINSIIISILLSKRPDMVKLILVDPKMVEMNAFREVPHLMCPIVTEMKRAEQILEWLTVKMDERYAVLAEAGVRNIATYNKLTEEEIYEKFQPTNEEEKAKIPLKIPYLVVIIDELADLMMTSAKEVEAYIIRLAQKSRAVGIHLVLATQRPQATVVTGLIKSNMPCRISFRVAARMDSRIVLDQNGAETLLGQGDMLFLQPGTSELKRAQGTFVEDNELNAVLKFLKEVAQPSFHPELVQMNALKGNEKERDELFDDAVRIILESQRGSVSLLQRRLTIGYSRASRLVDQMAVAGILGEHKGSQAREVLLTLDEYESIKRQMEKDAVMGYQDLQEDDSEPSAPAASAAVVEKIEEEPASEVVVEPDENTVFEEQAEVEVTEEELEEPDENEDVEYEYVYEDEDEDEEEWEEDEGDGREDPPAK